MIQDRVMAGLERVRAQVAAPEGAAPKVGNASRKHLSVGKGILKVAALVGVRSGTVQRVKREMLLRLTEVA